MTPTDKKIAVNALNRIENLHFIAFEAYRFYNLPLWTIVVQALYEEHGQPFGIQTNALKIWFEYHKSTTSN